MRDTPLATNVRRCHCADCRKILEKGQGIRYSYVMFHGNGQHFYCCPSCDAKREEKRLEDEKKASDRKAELMDREAHAQGVDYE